MSRKISFSTQILNGIFKENPTFVLVIGLCPTLAVTTSAINGLGMGVATLLVLVSSNFFISIISKITPSQVRIPVYVIVISTIVTVIGMLMQAYLPTLYLALGIFVPLIVVNCIILARAEMFAARNGPIASLVDGLGIGLGFTIALTLLGSIREILGSGTWFNQPLFSSNYQGVLIMILPPGAFLTIGVLMAIIQKFTKKGGE
ncbi:MAG: electron transport complex subunit E [Fusobacteria bacterium]|nr:electron transport complex subunit E [Fusobacteriota bacterium]